MGFCVVSSCKSSFYKGRRMYKFPKNPTRRRIWLENCSKKDWEPGTNHLICDVLGLWYWAPIVKCCCSMLGGYRPYNRYYGYVWLHFDENQFEQHKKDNWKKLKSNAVPTIFDTAKIAEKLFQLKSNNKRDVNSNKSSLEETIPTRLIYCRICACEIQSFVNIFQEDEFGRSLHRIIETYLPIKVSRGDQLPLQVCHKCSETLISWDGLISNVLDAEKKLREILAPLDDHDATEASLFASDFETDDEPLIKMKSPVKRSATSANGGPSSTSKKLKENLEQSGASEEPTATVECLLDELKKTENCVKAELTSPLKKNRSRLKAAGQADDKDSIDKCGNRSKQIGGKQSGSKDFCCLCMKAVRKLEKHQRKHETLIDVPLLFCPDCGLNVATAEDLGQHIYTHLSRDATIEDTNRCYICGAEFTGGIQMVRHLAVHVGLKTSPQTYVHCMVCGKALKPINLEKHMAGHGDSQRWTCHDCGKHYSQECGLVRHLRVVHEGLRRYKCPICPVIFKSHEELVNHQNIHTDPRPFQCDECGRTFQSHKHLYHHRRYHHTENGLRVKCRACEKVFSSTSVLKRHHKTQHLRLKEFQCEVCSAQLSTKQYLLEHLRTHKDERPEVCSVCGKTFRMAGNLRQHMKTHMERVHVCHVCDKRFARRCQLIIHVGSHRGLPPLECATCGQRFILKVDLQKHFAATHGNI